MVGRDGELERLGEMLDGLAEGAGQTLVVTGEPGIGKTRLLAELAARADSRGCLVLEGRGAEFERELPFGVVVDACDEYLASLDARAAQRLAGEGLGELTTIFPSLQSLTPATLPAPLVDERYRAHRAVRELLENLAVRQPVVLILDDVHWADEASTELLGHLVRRPPKGPVALALAHRTHQAPERLGDAIAGLDPEQPFERVELHPLSPADAAALVDDVDADLLEALYSESGGNPFYLEQLARSPTPSGGVPEPDVDGTLGLDAPPAVEAAIRRELEGLSPAGRTVVEAAAIAGDPFEPDVAAEIAEESESAIMPALDELMALGLVRATAVPRRFAFRHPIVRRVAREQASPSWRLGAHERAAEALAARGASPNERAYHVQQSARRGDEEAIELLCECGSGSAARAPAEAARCFSGALRLLPEDDASLARRTDLLESLAASHAATGRFGESHEALLEVLELLPADPTPVRTRLTAECASVEHVLGYHEEAHRRLWATFENLAEPASPEGVALMVELGVDAYYRQDHEAMRQWGSRALEAAGIVDDRALTASATAMLGWGNVVVGDAEAAGRYCSSAASLAHQLSDEEAAPRLDALSHIGWGSLLLGRLHEALAACERGIAISQATAQGPFLVQLQECRSNTLAVLGRLEDAIAMSEASIDGCRLSRSPQGLSLVLGGMCLWQSCAGDLDAARRAGEESLELARDLDDSALTVISAFDFAAYLIEAGEPERALELAIDAAGGQELPHLYPAVMALQSEILTQAALGAGRQREAELFAARAGAAAEELGWPVARTHAERARGAVLLAAGDLPAATQAALNSAQSAEDTGARLDTGRGRLLAGRALAAAGETERAQSELAEAEQTLHECGARRWRDEAGRELRKLGVRVERRGRGGATGDEGVASLTDREREVAELVWDRKTNGEIAAELFLSKKTVETHIRNMFRKLDVSSRVEIARAIEEARGER